MRLAVWLLGPAVKAAGFQALLLAMAGIALGTVAAAALLPGEQATRVAAGGLAGGSSGR